MIHRHALTARLVHALNSLRSDPSNALYLHILARAEIKQQYQELFEKIDLRRKWEKVRPEDLPQAEPEKSTSRITGSKVAMPLHDEEKDIVEELEAVVTRPRADPDVIEAVREVRRAEREERKRRSFGGWLKGILRRKSSVAGKPKSRKRADRRKKRKR